MITFEAFRQIVIEALMNKGSSVNAVKQEAHRYTAVITFRSHSGKRKWDSRLDFTNGGNVDGSYTYTQGYLGAAGPWVIGDEIARLIKENNGRKAI